MMHSPVCSALMVRGNILDARERQVSLRGDTRASATIAAVDCSFKHHNRIVGTLVRYAYAIALVMNRTAPVGRTRGSGCESGKQHSWFYLCNALLKDR